MFRCLTASNGRQKKLVQISLGYCSGKEVWGRISQEMEVGSWVLLHNGHQDVGLLNGLYKNLLGSNGRPGGPLQVAKHSGFRLWITMQECKDISVPFLLSCVRTSFEPPRGIKAGMTALYSDMVNQDLIDSMECGRDWSRLIYTLSYLHCMLRERQMYGSAGWSCKEEFDVSSWQACIAFMRDFMLDKGAKEIRKSLWTGIRYMINEVHSGSGIADDWDKRIVMVYTDRLFSEDSAIVSNDWFSGVQRPDTANIFDHLETIAAIKEEETADMLGLGPHSEMTVYLQRGHDMLQCLCQLETRNMTSTRAKMEVHADEHASHVLSKLPLAWKPEYIATQIGKLGPTSPLVMFLIRELDQMTDLISTSRKLLRELRSAIGGQFACTTAHESLIECVAAGKVPSQLTSISFAAPTLSTWLACVLARYDNMDRWLGSASKPKSYWLGGFFRPQGMIVALRLVFPFFLSAASSFVSPLLSISPRPSLALFLRPSL